MAARKKGERKMAVAVSAILPMSDLPQTVGDLYSKLSGIAGSAMPLMASQLNILGPKVWIEDYADPATEYCDRSVGDATAALVIGNVNGRLSAFYAPFALSIYNKRPGVAPLGGVFFHVRPQEAGGESSLLLDREGVPDIRGSINAGASPADMYLKNNFMVEQQRQYSVRFLPCIRKVLGYETERRSALNYDPETILSYGLVPWDEEGTAEILRGAAFLVGERTLPLNITADMAGQKQMLLEAMALAAAATRVPLKRKKATARVIRMYSQAMERFKAINWPGREGDMNIEASSVLFRSGCRDKAEELVNRAMDIFLKNGDDVGSSKLGAGLYIGQYE